LGGEKIVKIAQKSRKRTKGKGGLNTCLRGGDCQQSQRVCGGEGILRGSVPKRLGKSLLRGGGELCGGQRKKEKNLEGVEKKKLARK